MDKRKIYEEAGLTFVGKNTDGEDEFTGTKEAWEKADRLTQLELLGNEKTYE